MRVFVCGVTVVVLLLSSAAPIFANWGFEVGRASAGDVTDLAGDWNAFKRARARVNDALLKLVPIERQRQLLGVANERSDLAEVAEAAQQYWLQEVLAPLQRVALNPAATCAEAQFAGQIVNQMERQRQLIGLPDNATFANVQKATLEMVSLRCREEALDECVATGRFTQIIELMTVADRQAQLLGSSDDLESWAEDALKQCAIYELHFVSTTKAGHAPMGVETVRDGKVPIKLEIPPGGLKNAIRDSLGKILKGETSGGNNPFFVSVKCTPPVAVVNVVCSPAADSTSIEVAINALDLKHKEFYVGEEKIKNPRWEWEMRETEVSKQRTAGEDLFSFEFKGGKFSLKGLIKAPYNTASVPFPDWGNSFYMAHQKDSVGGPRSGILQVSRKAPELGRGVYPIIARFNYKDQNVFGGATVTDSTEFELIHKPKPKPFPERSREPNRRPLRPPSGQ